MERTAQFAPWAGRNGRLIAMATVVRPAAQMRTMRIEDLGVVSAMEAASYEFPWSIGIFADCLKTGHPCWVLCMGTAIAGYAILSVGAGEAHLLNICIDPGYRGQGLGRYLLGRMLDIARWNGAERLFLEVRPSNPLATKSRFSRMVRSSQYENR